MWRDLWEWGREQLERIGDLATDAFADDDTDDDPQETP